MGCWHGYLSGARYRLVYGPADAAVSCFSKIQIGFAFLVQADMGSPGKRAIKRVCVCIIWVHRWYALYVTPTSVVYSSTSVDFEIFAKHGQTEIYGHQFSVHSVTYQQTAQFVHKFVFVASTPSL